MRIADSVVLLTGSSRGIGAALATRLAGRGASVLLHGRDTACLDALSAELGTKSIVADLRADDAPAELAARACEIYGHVDAIVHCAGIGWYGAAVEMDRRSLDELITVNLHAPIELTRRLLPHMLAARRGHLVFVASIAGLTGVAHEAVYSATKAAVVTYADSLRLELAGTGVGVSVVSPGAVATEFCATRGQPYRRRTPRPVSPDRIAAAIERSIERNRAEVVIPHWLALAPTVRAVAPPVYRALARRFGG